MDLIKTFEEAENYIREKVLYDQASGSGHGRGLNSLGADADPANAATSSTTFGEAMNLIRLRFRPLLAVVSELSLSWVFLGAKISEFMYICICWERGGV